MVYKLYYFDGRGFGEATRQMFKLAGEDFEDIRVQHADWPALKSEMPFGQMPVLDVDGVKIPQSGAIGRFVARKFGFAGKTPLEMAWVDAIYDQFKDYYGEIKNYYYTHLGIINAGEKGELYTSVFVPARDKFYSFLTSQLKKTGTGYLVGDSVTWVDIVVADHMTSILSWNPDAFKGYPEVLELKKKVEAIPAIKEWIEKRPPSNF